jgi:hypothetical protein
MCNIVVEEVNKMSNKNIRERKELENLFTDPKYCKQAWKSVGQAILLQPAKEPVPFLDKDGNETFNSTLERYSYEQLANDIKELAKEDRAPTEIEMIMKCQMVKARTDTSAAVFIRDTLGAKPVDETKMDASVHNPFESMTDEELELIAKHREEQAAKESSKVEGE